MNVYQSDSMKNIKAQHSNKEIHFQCKTKLVLKSNIPDLNYCLDQKYVIGC